MPNRTFRALLVTASAALALGATGCAASSQRSAAPHAEGHASASAASAESPAAGGPGRTRIYHLAAETVAWDYTPDGRNKITGQPFGADENVFVASGPGRIGSRYLKCLYRGYTDGTFKTRAPHPAELGFLGPVIRAEVGDTIRVVFRNRCPFPTGVHPHGVAYDKGSEGAPYADGRTEKRDDAVPTGGEHTYVWQVPERAGPGPMDGPSVMWMYHGHTDEVADTYAGLMGAMVVTARGQARTDGSPKAVDREVFSLFVVMNENASPYLKANLRRFAQPPYELPEGEELEEFEESNLMHSINGYLYGNGPVPVLRRGERVRWYTAAMGSEVDLHTPHWHGLTALVGGMRMDVTSLLPAEMVTADLRPDRRGVWLFHCHVADHIVGGMQARFEVR